MAKYITFIGFILEFYKFGYKSHPVNQKRKGIYIHTVKPVLGDRSRDKKKWSLNTGEL